MLKLGEEAAEVVHVDDDASLVDDVQELEVRLSSQNSQNTPYSRLTLKIAKADHRLAFAGQRKPYPYSSLFPSLLPARQHSLIMNPEVDSAPVSVLFAAQHREKENRAGF